MNRQSVTDGNKTSAANIKGDRPLPEGYKARFYTDHITFVVCHIHKVEKVVRNGKGQVKRVKLSKSPVSVGVSLVNRDSSDSFDYIRRAGRYIPSPGLGKHIALQRALAEMPETDIDGSSPTTWWQSMSNNVMRATSLREIRNENSRLFQEAKDRFS